MEEIELINFIKDIRKLHSLSKTLKFKKIIIMKTKIKVEVEHETGINKLEYKRKGN